MKKVHFVLAGILVCSAVAAWALTPVEVVQAPQPLPSPLSAPLSAAGITCSFQCEDGTGYLLDCQEPTFGACCDQGEPACANNGGLSDGICFRGRLGLPCTGY